MAEKPRRSDETMFGRQSWVGERPAEHTAHRTVFSPEHCHDGLVRCKKRQLSPFPKHKKRAAWAALTARCGDNLPQRSDRPHRGLLFSVVFPWVAYGSTPFFIRCSSLCAPSKIGHSTVKVCSHLPLFMRHRHRGSLSTSSAIKVPHTSHRKGTWNT